MITEVVIRQLEEPGRYPGTPGSVQIYQTHLSVICIAGDDVYKLKKPVKLPFVDFSSKEKRFACCREEVRLNSRLCPGIYLGVEPLYITPDGVSFRRTGSQEIADFAVHMRRLPAERMMDVMLARNLVTNEDVDEIARIMVSFHGGARLEGSDAEAEAAAAPRELERFAKSNFTETARLPGGLFHPQLHRVLETRTRADFERHRDLLEARALTGHIVEGHGDLHARNICLCQPPAIYDCIEFNRTLRIQDVAAENAFLVMDLRYRKHPELGDRYLDTYIASSGDQAHRQLIPMFVRYRAMVRAKVAAIAAGESELDAADRQGCAESARRHLNLAAASAVEDDGTLLICACGLPACGKTYLFDAFAETSGWPCFSSDAVRKKRAGVPMDQPLPESGYTAENKRTIYAELLRRASVLLPRRCVLLDANFGSRELRRKAIQCARDAGGRAVFVYFEAPEREIARRLEKRSGDSGATSDADLAVYEKLKKGFEPPSEAEGSPVIKAPGAGDRQERIASILVNLLHFTRP